MACCTRHNEKQAGAHREQSQSSAAWSLLPAAQPCWTPYRPVRSHQAAPTAASAPTAAALGA